MQAPRGMEGVQQFALQQAMTAPQQEQARQDQIAAQEAERQARFEQQMLLEGGRREDRAAQRALTESLGLGNLQARQEANRIAAGTLGVKEEAAKEKRDAAQAAKDKEMQQMQQTINTIDQMIGVRDPVTGELVKGSSAHPGFAGYVGATWLPGMHMVEGSDPASYKTMHEQVTSTARLEGIRMLKGTGAVSNAEGAAAAQAIQRMSKAASEKEYIKAAREYRDILQRGLDRTQKGIRVDDSGREQLGGAPAPAPAGGAATVVRRVRLKDGRTGVEWSDGRRTVE
jgi:hypothetical protein